jgi:hypothetical protein
MNIPANIFQWKKNEETKSYDRVFHYRASVVGYATEGELEHGSGEIYPIAIIECDGELDTVPVTLVTLDYEAANNL